MRHRGKVDRSQPAIVEALRGAGATVVSLANVGDGCPDLLVGSRRMTYLLECKSGPRDGLTDDQRVWHLTWHGWPVAVVRSVDEALDVIGIRQGETA